MKLLVLLACLVTSSLLVAQQGFDIRTQSFDVFFDEYENPVIFYEHNKNSSLYKMCKLFHADVNAVLKYNDLKNDKELDLGDRVKIPVDFEYIFRGNSIKSFKNTAFVPLEYKVKPKENLFRISKVYCGESIEAMMKRNNLRSKDLNIGQKLILGWLPVDEVSKKYITSTEIKEHNRNVFLDEEHEIARRVAMYEDIDVDTLALDDQKDLNLTKEKGIAIWTKQSTGHSKFALHSSAKLNSEIELFNPIVQRRVKAKVIGRIPDGAYSEDVSVIISPATAVSLGALDSRFSVVMTYEE